MAIKASLAYVSNPSNDVDKLIIYDELKPEFDVEATGTMDDIECNFILNGSNFFTFNYLVVKWPGSDLSYCYFINKRQAMSGNRTLLTCELDVLQTFSRIISESPAVIARTDNPDYVNFFVRDNKVPIISTTQISTNNFGKEILPGNAQEYIYVGIWQTSKAVGGAST